MISRIHRRPLVVFATAFLVATMSLFSAYSNAAAATFTGSATLSATHTERVNLLDTGYVYANLDAGFPVGDIVAGWIHFTFFVDYKVDASQPVSLNLTAPDVLKQASMNTADIQLNATTPSGNNVKVTAHPGYILNYIVDGPSIFGIGNSVNCSQSDIPDLATLDAVATGAQTAPGCVDYTGSLNTDNGAPDFGDFTLFDAQQTFPYTGTATFPQTSNGPSLDIGNLIFGVSGVLSLTTSLHTSMQLTANPGYGATRSIQDPNAGTTLQSDALTWTAPDLMDTFTLSCSAVIGDNISYNLSNLSWAGNISASVDSVSIGLHVDYGIGTLDVTLFTINIGYTMFDTPITLSTGTGFNPTIGSVTKYTQNPTVGMGSIPSNGTEGTPIALGVVGTGSGGALDLCDSPSQLSYAWSFDDGGSAYGQNISHLFDDENGTSPHSGQVVITDRVGNTTTLNFAVPVAPVNPAVSAGSAKTAEWGDTVSFHANGTSPSASDQASLQYLWNWNDPNSPLDSTGQDVSHVFSQPGMYPVQVSATDDGGNTSSLSTVNVTVNKRGTSLVYTGPTSGVPNETSALGATMTDDHGQPVVGRTVTFTLSGGSSIASAVTNSSGIAQVNMTITAGQTLGAQTMAVSFAGDSMYISSSASPTPGFTVAKRPTTITYTGPNYGKPNSYITLSAQVVDNLNRPVVTYPVNFTLGSGTDAEHATASTNASGIASVTIQVKQKLGTYSLVSSFAGDARYASGTTTITFTVK